MSSTNIKLSEVLDLLVARINEARVDISKLSSQTETGHERWDVVVVDIGAEPNGWEPFAALPPRDPSDPMSRTQIVLRRRIP